MPWTVAWGRLRGWRGQTTYGTYADVDDGSTADDDDDFDDNDATVVDDSNSNDASAYNSHDDEVMPAPLLNSL